MARKYAKILGRRVECLGDLQGPKFRVGELAGDPIELREGDVVEFGICKDAPLKCFIYIYNIEVHLGGMVFVTTAMTLWMYSFPLHLVPFSATFSAVPLI